MSGVGKAVRARPRYVIINDCDAPEPKMVCQWVDRVGYCYLDRRGTKPTHDGMQGAEATPVTAFGFVFTENTDGTVSFYRSTHPNTATYRDGKPRRWQHDADSFEFRRLVRKKRKVVTITPGHGEGERDDG